MENWSLDSVKLATPTRIVTIATGTLRDSGERNQHYGEKNGGSYTSWLEPVSF